MHLICNTSVKNFVAGVRKESVINSRFFPLMGFLKCQWGYQFPNGILISFSGVWNIEWGSGKLSGVGEKSVGLPEKSVGSLAMWLLQRVPPYPIMIKFCNNVLIIIKEYSISPFQD